jgi:hypothetical protein
VNIDNGFGAAYVAAMIVRTRARIAESNGSEDQRDAVAATLEG